MLTKDNVTIGIEWRFGPDWPGQRCGAKTRRGAACLRPANKKNGRCRLHGGASTGAKTQEGRARISAANLRPTPWPNSFQISQPSPVTPIGDPRPTIRGSRSVDHGPRRLDLGPRTRVQGSGKVAGKVLTVDLWRRFANLLI